MIYRKITLLLMCCLAWAGVSSAQAQDILERTSSTPDSLDLPQLAAPRVSYGLTAGAFVSNFGSGSFLEPRVQYRVSPRFSVFSSLQVVQSWGGPTFRTSPTGEGNPMNPFGTAADRQYLLHVGGAYAMTEKLLLTGSVWKDLNPNASSYRNMYSPYGFGRLPQQGFNFQAHYQVSPNVTISGGVRSGNGFNQGFGGYPGGGFGSPWGY